MPAVIQVRINTSRGSIFGGIIGKAAWPVGRQRDGRGPEGRDLRLRDARARSDRVQGDPDFGLRCRQLRRQRAGELRWERLRWYRLQPDRRRHDQCHRTECDMPIRGQHPGSGLRDDDVRQGTQLVRPSRPAAQPAGAAAAGARPPDEGVDDAGPGAGDTRSGELSRLLPRGDGEQGAVCDDASRPV